ncbi:MAG: glycoside hydrolase family 95-like protein, partial [Planctomycetota bacterium]
HRHISHLYGLFPGNCISRPLTLPSPQRGEGGALLLTLPSPRRAEGLARACEVVLEQRGLEGNGWSSAWKMACWARLFNADKALENFRYYIRHYTCDSLFALCAKALQVDGSCGVAAAIMEMFLQSHENELHLLPALPRAWNSGEVRGLRARGGFEVDLAWRDSRISAAAIRSFKGGLCRVRSTEPLQVFHRRKLVSVQQNGGKTISFQTAPGYEYELRPEGRSA